MMILMTELKVCIISVYIEMNEKSEIKNLNYLSVVLFELGTYDRTTIYKLNPFQLLVCESRALVQNLQNNITF